MHRMNADLRAAVSGTVHALPTLDPLSYALVRVTDATDTEVALVLAAEDGTYIVTGLRPGHYRMRAEDTPLTQSLELDL